jgi:DNA (cytosine-5)-methyltransferase 1
MSGPTIVDLFAGPGGWSLGLKSLGLEDVGVEMDADIAATREALGLQTIHADVRSIPVDAWRQIDGLIASPPCQTFSQAGKKMGLADARGLLIYEPRRFIEAHLPDFVAFEEVPPVLPFWEEYAAWLRDIGYRVWTGILNAADYGVPQSRKRAFLFATRNGISPEPYRGDYARRPPATPDLFGGRKRRWITAAEVLPHRTDLPEWAHRRPATTIVRSFCPHVVSAPGYRKAGDGPRQKAPGSFEVTLDEMATLQGAWPGMPFCGSKTKRFSICGALLPPPWASGILRHLVEPYMAKVA